MVVLSLREVVSMTTPMLTLEEAVAKLDDLLEEPPILSSSSGRVWTVEFDWGVKVDAIRTAVRDVALATEQLGQDGMRHSEILAEIKRDLGDSPHG